MAAMDAFLHAADPAHGHTLTARETADAAGAAGLEVRTVDRVRRGVWGLAVVTAVRR